MGDNSNQKGEERGKEKEKQRFDKVFRKDNI